MWVLVLGLLLTGTGSGEDAGPSSIGYLIHLSTDKPIYRPGEPLFFRGVIMHALDRHPHAGTLPATIRITAPRGEVVWSSTSIALDSVIGTQWDIPTDSMGGVYRIRVTASNCAPASREFSIQAVRAPRLTTQLVFARAAYGPGDTVSAELAVSRSEGGVPAGAKVTIIARVDGTEIHRSVSTVDGSGKCHADFQLPALMVSGQGSLAFVIDDGAQETAVRSIPISLRSLDLHLYPEGGDLIAGMPTRLYGEAFLPNGRPADFTGDILNGAGAIVATLHSQHEGRARCGFLPKAGERYRLRLREPADLPAAIDLPAVLSAGGVIGSDHDIYEPGYPVSLRASSTSSGPVSISLSRCGVQVGRYRGGSCRRHHLDHLSDASVLGGRGADGPAVRCDRQAPRGAAGVPQAGTTPRGHGHQRQDDLRSR